MENGTMMLLPPRDDLCQVCAGNHEPNWPHNAQSMYYQVSFQMQHGRAPNWNDAMEHCSDEMRQLWTEELVALGVDVEAGQVNPPKSGVSS
ncbi:hypothetical protein LWE61_15165 [Sphingobium sufflavum]|uniref:hypothetical protein n=1 Tax=Sphingobium sufflavum TaxID=1129547 RepID=UPI001F310F20|nr:hypothetical protein [Sphingobium sufflavum]MCE7797889.1 hypothetical protein [Sphingobium sufflavum]